MKITISGPQVRQLYALLMVYDNDVSTAKELEVEYSIAHGQSSKGKQLEYMLKVFQHTSDC